MIKKTTLLFLLINSFTYAQFTVKGTMSPPYKSNWVILYKIEGARQLFVKNINAKKDTVLIDGKKQVVANFQFILPQKPNLVYIVLVMIQKENIFSILYLIKKTLLFNSTRNTQIKPLCFQNLKKINYTIHI